MSNLMLAIVGAAGIFIGYHVLFSFPSLWGFSAIISGMGLFSIGVIRDYGVTYG